MLRHRSDRPPWLVGPRPGNHYLSVAFSPDGRRVYLGGMGHTLFNPPSDDPTRDSIAYRSKVQAWRTDNRFRADWAADGERGSVVGLLALPDGGRVVAADGGGVWLVDAATGQRRGGLLTFPDVSPNLRPAQNR